MKKKMKQKEPVKAIKKKDLIDEHEELVRDLKAAKKNGKGAISKQLSRQEKELREYKKEFADKMKKKTVTEQRPDGGQTIYPGVEPLKKLKDRWSMLKANLQNSATIRSLVEDEDLEKPSQEEAQAKVAQEAMAQMGPQGQPVMPEEGMEEEMLPEEGMEEEMPEEEMEEGESPDEAIQQDEEDLEEESEEEPEEDEEGMEGEEEFSEEEMPEEEMEEEAPEEEDEESEEMPEEEMSEEDEEGMEEEMPELSEEEISDYIDQRAQEEGLPPLEWFKEHVLGSGESEEMPEEEGTEEEMPEELQSEMMDQELPVEQGVAPAESATEEDHPIDVRGGHETGHDLVDLIDPHKMRTKMMLDEHNIRMMYLQKELELMLKLKEEEMRGQMMMAGQQPQQQFAKSESEVECDCGAEEELEKGEKPFHGYNKKKHAKSGGLNDSYREKYNREHGSNLQRPSKDKKNPRHKSFCARMKGVKGPTSKEGKLTPKGASLKRWGCS
jgi:hypothetical protein